MRWRERAAWLLVVLGWALIIFGVAAGCHLSAAAARSAIGPCPVTGAGPYQACVLMPRGDKPQVGQEITDSPGRNGCVSTPWMVTDHTGAPMAWVNCYGLYSGGAPGFPGGLICTTRDLVNAACLTPDTGTLELFDAQGRHPVTLTRADIIYLHHLERNH